MGNMIKITRVPFALITGNVESNPYYLTLEGQKMFFFSNVRGKDITYNIDIYIYIKQNYLPMLGVYIFHPKKP